MAVVGGVKVYVKEREKKRVRKRREREGKREGLGQRPKFRSCARATPFVTCSVLKLVRTKAVYKRKDEPGKSISRKSSLRKVNGL